MLRISGQLAAVLALGLAMPAAANERRLIASQDLVVFAPGAGGWCADTVPLRVEAASRAAFDGDRTELQRVLAGARAVLSLECPQLRAMLVTGWAGGTEVFSGIAAGQNGWRLTALATPAAPQDPTPTAAPPPPAQAAAAPAAAPPPSSPPAIRPPVADLVQRLRQAQGPQSRLTQIQQQVAPLRTRLGEDLRPAEVLALLGPLEDGWRVQALRAIVPHAANMTGAEAVRLVDNRLAAVHSRLEFLDILRPEISAATAEDLAALIGPLQDDARVRAAGGLLPLLDRVTGDAALRLAGTPEQLRASHARVTLVGQLARRVENLGVEEALQLAGPLQDNSRVAVLDALLPRIQGLSGADAVRLAGGRAGLTVPHARFRYVQIVARELERIEVAEAADLLGALQDAPRAAAIEGLLPRLPALSAADALRLAGGRDGFAQPHARLNYVTLVARVLERITVDEAVELIGPLAGSQRSGAVRALTPRLGTVSGAEALRLAGPPGQSQEGVARAELVVNLAPAITDLKLEDALVLAGSPIERDRRVQVVAALLPRMQGASNADLLRLGAPQQGEPGHVRLAAIRALAPHLRAPTAAEIEQLLGTEPDLDRATAFNLLLGPEVRLSGAEFHRLLAPVPHQSRGALLLRHAGRIRSLEPSDMAELLQTVNRSQLLQAFRLLEPGLSGPMPLDALRDVLRPVPAWDLADLLRGMAPRLDAGNGREAAAQVARIDRNVFNADAIRLAVVQDLIPRLARPLDEAGLRALLGTLSAQQRGDAWVSVARYHAPLAPASAAALLAVAEGAQGLARLAQLAPHLPPRLLLADALAIAGLPTRDPHQAAIILVELQPRVVVEDAAGLAAGLASLPAAARIATLQALAPSLAGPLAPDGVAMLLAGLPPAETGQGAVALATALGEVTEPRLLALLAALEPAQRGGFLGALVASPQRPRITPASAEAVLAALPEAERPRAFAMLLALLPEATPPAVLAGLLDRIPAGSRAEALAEPPATATLDMDGRRLLLARLPEADRAAVAARLPAPPFRLQERPAGSGFGIPACETLAGFGRALADREGRIPLLEAGGPAGGVARVLADGVAERVFGAAPSSWTAAQLRDVTGAAATCAAELAGSTRARIFVQALEALSTLPNEIEALRTRDAGRSRLAAYRGRLLALPAGSDPMIDAAEQLLAGEVPAEVGRVAQPDLAALREEMAPFLDRAAQALRGRIEQAAAVPVAGFADLLRWAAALEVRVDAAPHLMDRAGAWDATDAAIGQAVAAAARAATAQLSAVPATAAGMEQAFRLAGDPLRDVPGHDAAPAWLTEVLNASEAVAAMRRDAARRGTQVARVLAGARCAEALAAAGLPPLEADRAVLTAAGPRPLRDVVCEIEEQTGISIEAAQDADGRRVLTFGLGDGTVLRLRLVEAQAAGGRRGLAAAAAGDGLAERNPSLAEWLRATQNWALLPALADPARTFTPMPRPAPDGLSALACPVVAEAVSAARTLDARTGATLGAGWPDAMLREVLAPLATGLAGALAEVNGRAVELPRTLAPGRDAAGLAQLLGVVLGGAGQGAPLACAVPVRLALRGTGDLAGDARTPLRLPEDVESARRARLWGTVELRGPEAWQPRWRQDFARAATTFRATANLRNRNGQEEAGPALMLLQEMLARGLAPDGEPLATLVVTHALPAD